MHGRLNNIRVLLTECTVDAGKPPSTVSVCGSEQRPGLHVPWQKFLRAGGHGHLT